MKAFIAFVVVLFLVIGAGGGFWAWKKMEKVEEWGLALSLGSEISETERDTVEERYNMILDRGDVLKNCVETHNLQNYYEVSSSEDAVAKLKEDTFIRIHQNKNMHILFRGQRKTRKEREAAVRTLSEDFLKKVQEMSER